MSYAQTCTIFAVAKSVMNILDIWLLALSLAMDCFSISLASGVILRHVDWRVFLKMAFFFGLFQGLMPVLGWLGASLFSSLIEEYDHWVAFALLCVLGIRMIVEGCKGGDEPHSFDPSSLKVILALAVATSIDALAVGVTFAFTGLTTVASLVVPVSVIAAVAFVLSLAGNVAGALAGCLCKLRMEIVGGLVLIAIGTKILCEHLGVI